MKIKYENALPLLIAAFFFLWFTSGVRILDPTNVSWIIDSNGDPDQHYAGWLAFRYAPFLQWPFGLNGNYGEALGASVVYSDSLPLLAFLFKPVANLLPSDFQYMGFWFLACFILQALFAWRLIRRFSDSTAVAALGTALVTLSAPMLWRMTGHEALVGQWIILAALNIYFDAQRKWLKWTVLLGVAVLVHAYLFAMAAAVWALDIGMRLRNERARLLAGAAVTLAVVGFLMWFAGYFLGGSVATNGFGYFRANLFTFFNPIGLSSSFFATGAHGGDYEGMSYLGLGNIAVLTFALYALASRTVREQINPRVLWPLVALAAVLFAYAMSNHILAGNHELLSYRLPKFTQKITGVFRCSGRFAWPVMYLVELGALFLLVRRFPRGVVIALLSVCVLIQLAEVQKLRSYLHDVWSRPPHEFRSDFWKSVPQQYRRVAIVPPIGQSIVPITIFALRHGMSINDVDRARLGGKDLEEAQAQVMNEIEASKFRSDTLYVFRTRPLFDFSAANSSSRDFVGAVDGYAVLAPAWKGCNPTCGKPAPGPFVAPVTTFAAGGNADSIRSMGWSPTPDEAGWWTDGGIASLGLQMGDLKKDATVKFMLHAFTYPGHPIQAVHVFVNGRHEADWGIGAGKEAHSITIRPADVNRMHGYANIDFHLPDALSPLDAGLSTDERQLGIAVESMTVDPVPGVLSVSH